MAAINPELPVQQPNLTGYMGYSNPISAFEGDKSSGIAVKGFGDTLEAVVKGTDAVIKQDINTKTAAAVEAERNAYTQSLEQVRNSTSGAPPVGNGSKNNILSGETGAPVPADVANAGAYAENLSGAYEAGKISQTYYYARLAEQAKTLRSQYPGYREEIDAAFKSATGVIPANAYAASLISDINKAQSSVKDDFTKTQDALRGFVKEGVPGSVEAYEGFSRSGDVNGANKWMNQTNADKYQREINKSKREDWAGSRNQGQAMALDDAETHASTTVANHFSAIQGSGGLNGKKISEIIADSSDRELKGLPALLTDEQGSMLSRSIRNSKLGTASAIWAEWSAPIKDRNGNTTNWITQMGGATKAKETLDANMTMYDRVADAIESKDYGLAHRLANMNRNLIEGAKNGLYTSSSIGPQMQTLTALKDMPPDWVKTYITSATSAKGSVWAPDIDEWVKTSKGNFFAQPLLKTTGEISTVKSAVETAKRAKVTDPTVYTELLNTSNALSDPSTRLEEKHNAAIAFFDPQNRGMISKFTIDSRDPQTGRPIPGRIAAFESLTTPVKATAMADLSKTYPQDGKNYVEWVESSVGSELLNKEIKDLNDNQSIPGTRLRWISDPKTNTYKYKLEFDHLAQVPGTPQRAPDYDSIKQANAQIERLNRGIQGLANVYKAFGKDETEAYVLNFIHGMGFKPTTNIEGYPAKMMNAIITTKMGQQPKAK